MNKHEVKILQLEGKIERTKETIRRLTIWRDELSKPKLPVDVFNISCYYERINEGMTDGCGTAACALGVAGLTPTFQELGLESEISAEGFCGNVIYRREEDGVKIQTSSYTAAADFFGIEKMEAVQICSPSNYQAYNEEGDLYFPEVTVNDVIPRIDKLIHNYREILADIEYSLDVEKENAETKTAEPQ